MCRHFFNLDVDYHSLVLSYTSEWLTYPGLVRRFATVKHNYSKKLRNSSLYYVTEVYTKSKILLCCYCLWMLVDKEHTENLEPLDLQSSTLPTRPRHTPSKDIDQRFNVWCLWSLMYDCNWKVGLYRYVEQIEVACLSVCHRWYRVSTPLVQICIGRLEKQTISMRKNSGVDLSIGSVFTLCITGQEHQGYMA